jgi:ectoine hydroxylase-related dioxygenase (phytanoyl-CoA dioxygenase family)
MKLSEDQKSFFARNGYLLIEGFYDRSSLVDPIRAQIAEIIETLCRKHAVKIKIDSVDDALTVGYTSLAKADRSWGSEVYDAIKQIPSFMRIVSSSSNDEVFSELRNDALPGLAAGGYGIRIDNPGEQKFRAPWHQEFPGQLRSLDGIVFWSPLVEVTPDLGPVEIASGSHKEGVVPVFSETGDGARSGAYGLRLDKEAQRLEKYKKVSPVSKPGDLILMDFLTLHQSGQNVSTRPRWSMQWRYFNFKDATGVKIGWKGSFAEGTDFAKVLPELVASP